MKQPFNNWRHMTIGALVASSCMYFSCTGVIPKDELVIDMQEKGAEVAPSMYGVFFEEINGSADFSGGGEDC